MARRQELGRDLALLGPAACADLLRVLTSPSHVRADVIRQFYERPGGQDVAELLMLCEEDDFKRAAVIEALGRLGHGGTSGKERSRG